MIEAHPKFMRRALSLASLGRGTTGSNPMVGAVIVSPDGRIIGEGWHRRFGEGHAEVNAVASVADRSALADSTMYVTLEPCSHYGKTPPCANLIIDNRIPRVVVATADPFEKVSGRGIAMMREAGVEVSVGMLGEESRRLNAAFFTAHTLHRPFIFLKWAQTADGQMHLGGKPVAISTLLTQMEVHRLRSRFNGIITGSGTVTADNPRLDTRLWPMGSAPRRIVLDRQGIIPASSRILGEGTIYVSASERVDISPKVSRMIVEPDAGLDEILRGLYARGIISVMVEGGPTLLSAFLESGLWDVARRETNPRICLGKRFHTPLQPSEGSLAEVRTEDGNIIEIFTNNPLVDVKNL